MRRGLLRRRRLLPAALGLRLLLPLLDPARNRPLRPLRGVRSAGVAAAAPVRATRGPSVALPRFSAVSELISRWWIRWPCANVPLVLPWSATTQVRPLKLIVA